MKENNTSLYKAELEDISGKIYNGELTPLVFELLKDSPHLEDLLKELTGSSILDKPEVHIEKPVSAPKFEEWFNGFQKLR